MSVQSASGGSPLPATPLVTVIIRTKDRLGLLERAAASVVAQDWRPLELLVVNDGGADPSEVLRPFADRLDAMRIVPAAAPGGRVAAANTGLQEARGDCLIFLDDDDWFHPPHIAALVAALQANPGQGLAYTGVECCREDPATGALQRTHVFNEAFDPASLLIRNFIPMHAALFRRSLLDADTRFDPRLDFYEDWDFWLQLARKTGFTHVEGITACYFLGSSGFGVEQTERQRAAEQVFFAKWQQLWTPEELRLVIDYARQLPGVRQHSHEQLLALSQRLEALSQRYENLQSLHGQALVRINELQTSEAGLQASNLQLKDEQAATRLQLEAVLASSSWRLTAPLRRMVLLARRWQQRLRSATALLRTGGPAAVVQQLRRRQNGSAAGAGTADHGIQPIALRHVRPEDAASLARQLRFAVADAPRVSVIIPAYNHCALTLACLQSLHEHLPDCPLELIVVDDASTDDTAQLLAQVQGLRLLRNDDNSGFIRTCNRGAEAARGEFLFFLNNDTELQADWLEPLLAVFDADPRCGIAGSKLVYPSGYLQEAGACLRADGTVDLVGLNGDPADPRYNRVRPVDHCSGAAILVRAALFRELGGFDQRYAPAYFEDCDLSLKVQQAGYKVVYQPASVVVHHLSVSTGNLPGGKLAQIARNREIYLARWGRYLRERDKIRLIAFYLPQFHPIPENDAWWGKGFTEWTNVTRAQPLFDGHVQPQRPGELGYYDLRAAEVREQQAALAREYGIHGFCYYYYWFNGKRLLERPLNDMLRSGSPDFPFCVCWANENWTRRWDGREAEVLMAQQYDAESNQRFMQDLLPVLRDPRYIRIDGRPLVLIYRAELIPGLGEAVAGWRQLLRDEGLGELYLAAVESFSGVRDELTQHFDALVEFPPHGRSVPLAEPPRGLCREFSGQLFDYAASSESFMQRQDCPPHLFRTAMPSWDNTPRRQQAAHIYLGATPYRYQHWLARIVRETREQRIGDERIVFVNAWNEWAEGNHLEPDVQHGRDWLEATRLALGSLGTYPDLREPDAAEVLPAAGEGAA